MQCSLPHSQLLAGVTVLAMHWYPLHRNILLFFGPVYYGGCVSISVMMMDLGSDSGNLSGIGSISNLILMDLIREHSLTVGMYMSGTDSSISSLICFNHSWHKKYCFILTVSSIPSGRPNS